MNRTRSFGTGVLAAGLLMTGSAHAHVKMLKPTPWIVEDDGFAGAAGGNPQKAGPCGPGSSDRPTLTNAITTFKPGETITVQWTETVAHPGYYRIALAENRADLKDPTVPFTDQRNCNVDHSKIPTGAHDNVLADGILIQAPNGPARPGYPNFTFQVKLPDKPCEKCTLQLIQFMEAHPPSCIYYHCADIKIAGAGAATDAGVTSDAGAATDAGASSDAGGSTGGTPGGATLDAGSPTASRDAGGGTTPGTSVGGGPVVVMPGTTSDAGTSAPGTAGAGGGTTGANGPGTLPDDDEDEGCSVAWPGAEREAPLGILLALGLTALAIRRRLQR